MNAANEVTNPADESTNSADESTNSADESTMRTNGRKDKRENGQLELVQ